jgi:hypothetical protein
MNNSYYVYNLLDPRYEHHPPFYTGKGSGNRANMHMHESKRRHENPRKYAKIQKIRAAGLEPIIEYYATDLSEEDAYKLEAELIIKFGRAGIDEGGILTNLLLDGRPPLRSGPMSDEQKEAIRKGNSGKIRTLEQCAELSRNRKGRPRASPTEETKELIRLGNIAAKVDIRLSDDLTGRTFGSYTVAEKSRDERPRIRGANGIYWKCLCSSCDKEKEVQQSQLMKGTFRICCPTAS